MSYMLNPKRRNLRTWQQKFRYYFQLPFIRFGLWLGFENTEYSYISGDESRLKIGKGCSTMNTLFNLNSGTITIGDNTIFGYNCMIITGQHQFYQGKRVRLQSDVPFEEVPEIGNDIRIGSGCFICSGAVIIKGVTIGDHVIIGANSVVARGIPSNCFAAGNPAKVIKYFDKEEQLV